MTSSEPSTPDGLVYRKFAEERGGQLLDPSLPSPNFFIVGAPKAGTTSLHAYLSRHPDVFMSKRKEPHYFSSFKVEPDFDNFVPVIRDFQQYQELFRGSAGFKAIGEASTSYLSDSHAANLIKAVVPGAKIIVSLRNPIERAYSHYLMECREGRETRSFREALAADQARVRKGWGISLQYIELGLYSHQVEHYINVFGRPNVLVILFEDFSRDTVGVMNEVASFLNLNPARFPESAFDTVYHSFAASSGALSRWILRCRPIRLWAKRSIPVKVRHAVRDRFLFKKIRKPGLEEPVRQSLAEFFAPDVQRLEQLLERDLGVLRENR